MVGFNSPKNVEKNHFNGKQPNGIRRILKWASNGAKWMFKRGKTDYYTKTIVKNRPNHIEILVDGRLTKVEILNSSEDIINDKKSQYLLTSIINNVQDLISLGLIVRKVLLLEFTETQAVIKCIGQFGEDFGTNIIEVTARQHAIDMGNKYINQMEESGNLDADLASLARLAFEKKRTTSNQNILDTTE